MLEKSSLRKRCVILVLLVLGLLLGAAWAQTESVLYSFCAQKNCADGAVPSSRVVFDQKGNLYGTTQLGGANHSVCDQYIPGCGVVFKLTTEGRATVLYSFCAQNDCSDGAVPGGGLVFDKKGNLYGATAIGGVRNDLCVTGCGVVFELTAKGKEKVLYSFCARTNCTDGMFPSGPFLDQKGNMYGTTYEGGAYNDCQKSQGCGVVFKITPKGKETVLYSFCAQGGSNCTDGAHPVPGVVFDQEGNLYGAASGGGAHGGGVVFKLTPKGKETVLYSFCSQNNCADGASPVAGVIFDHRGNLYGTTHGGGNSCDGNGYGCGVAFKLTPEGMETVLYSFCSNRCADGLWPEAGLTFDRKGNLYGTTSDGGDACNGYGCGVVFKLTPRGKETVLYTFEGSDGANPGAGVVFDLQGNLYGTTFAGGAYNDCADAGCGVVFKLTP
jgi:uncharacterized repeat protein (TIGR03803 family)